MELKFRHFQQRIPQIQLIHYPQFSQIFRIWLLSWRLVSIMIIDGWIDFVRKTIAESTAYFCYNSQFHSTSIIKIKILVKFVHKSRQDLTPRRPICRARHLGMFFVSQGFVLDVISKRWKNTPIEIKFPFFWKQVWLSKHSSLATIILRKKLGLIIHFMVFTQFLIWGWNFGQRVTTYFRMTLGQF